MIALIGSLQRFDSWRHHFDVITFECCVILVRVWCSVLVKPVALTCPVRNDFGPDSLMLHSVYGL